MSNQNNESSDISSIKFDRGPSDGNDYVLWCANLKSGNSLVCEATYYVTVNASSNASSWAVIIVLMTDPQALQHTALPSWWWWAGWECESTFGSGCQFSWLDIDNCCHVPCDPNQPGMCVLHLLRMSQLLLSRESLWGIPFV